MKENWFPALMTFMMACALVSQSTDGKVKLQFSLGEEEAEAVDCSHDAVSDEELYETALHEAGHALAMERIGVEKVSQVQVFPTGSSLGDGTCVDGVTNIDGNVEFDHPDVVRAKIAGLYGGYLATKLYLDRYGSGSSRDIDMATHYAIDAVHKWGLGSVAVPYSTSQLRDHGIHPFDLEADGDDMTLLNARTDVRNFLEDGYELAELHIRSSPKTLEEIAQALVDHTDHTLTGDELRTIVNGVTISGISLTEDQSF